MLLKSHHLALSAVALAVSLTGCQGAVTTAAASPGAVISTPAAFYQPVRVAGNTYQLLTDQIQLQVQQDNRTLASVAGRFSRLTVQVLDDDSLLLAAAEEDSNSLYLWQFSPKQAAPLRLLQQQLISSRVIEDLCFYQSSENQQLSLFVLGGRGGADQLLLRQQQQWLVTPLRIRELSVPYDSTACAVDQQLGALYVAEGKRALWRYQAEPEADEGRDLVQVGKPFGQLRSEIKALRLLDDGSLLALEEEPVRVLHITADGTLLRAVDVSALAEASSLGVSQGVDATELFIGNEAADPVQQLSLLVSAKAETAKAMPQLPEMAQLMPVLQTEAASQRGDVMDDPAVWHHPTQPERSLLLATDKRAGLDVYNMQGKRVQQLAVGRLNNVDSRYNLSWQGARHDIAVASLRDNNSLQLFAIDMQGKLHEAGQVATAMDEIYGLCMYHSRRSGKHYVFVNDKSGLIEQYLISSDGTQWQGKRVRTLRVPSQPEGCVADDQHAELFVGEEDAGIWRFAAEPDASEQGDRIIQVDGKVLVDDVEGLALAEHNGKRYLIASSQGNDSYVIYDAVAPYTLRLRFRVTTNPLLGIDGTSETDGLELTTASLGPGFEQGALIVQDGRNRMPEQGQNLKLVPWSVILQQLGENSANK